MKIIVGVKTVRLETLELISETQNLADGVPTERIIEVPDDATVTKVEIIKPFCIVHYWRNT